MVNSASEAARAVQASRYPPVGVRSYGGPRTRLYGGLDYFEHANEEIAVIVQIEHIDAVSHIDEILSVKGVDAYFIGPADLAASMGIKPGLDLTEVAHVEAISRVVASGKKQHLPGGILVGSAEATNARLAQGFQFIGIGSDEGFLRSAASATLSKVSQNRKVS